MKVAANISFSKLFGSLLVLFLILFGASAIGAWTGPTQSAPSGNVSAPVNVGTIDQIKNSGLSVNALSVFGGTYVQGSLGVGAVASGADLDVNGTVRIRGGGTPSAGKILVAGDSTGNLVWATLSYQEAQTFGPFAVYNLSATQTAGTPLAALVADMKANGNVTPNSAGTPYNDSATRERMCLILGGSSNATVSTYLTGSYYSPSDNYIYKWNGIIWVRYGASSYNSYTSSITCQTPGGLRVITDFGDTIIL